jgi:hypothetical protein
MPAGHSILRLMLILAVLGNCLPGVTLEDANRDRRIDLSDAVAQVRHLVETARTSAPARVDFQKAIRAVQATAGLETVIQAAADPADTGRLSMTVPGLLSDLAWSQPVACGRIRPDTTCRFASLFPCPPSPPPEPV